MRLWLSANARNYLPIALAVVIIYGICSTVVAPDLKIFLYPWIDHIRAQGAVRAFAAPFANYTPPYLYLLAAGTLLTSSSLLIVKALAIASTLFAAATVGRLVSPNKSAGEAAMIALLLPTMIADGPVLGQCDGIWSAFCMLSIAAAIEGRLLAMVVWSGIAFAFKAQAAFIAPFVIAVLTQRRASVWLWAVPGSIYCFAMLPAWLIGWPASNLVTVYLRQGEYFNTIGSAPGPWSIVAAFMPPAPPSFLWVGLLAAGVFVVAYVAVLSRSQLTRAATIEAALLSALALPFLLPKMHERFTFLADLLALALAFVVPCRANGIQAACVIGASSLAYLGFMGEWPWLTIIGCILNAGVLWRLAVRLLGAARLWNVASVHQAASVAE